MRSKYRLPKELYMRTLWLIRDYDRLRLRREEILEASPAPPDGRPKGGGSSRGGIEIKAMNLADVDAQIGAVDKALARIPKEYRKGVWNSIQFRTPFPIDAAINTYKMWKQRFVFWTAVYLGWL